MNQQVNPTRHDYRRVFKNHGGGNIGYWEGWVEAPNRVIMQHAKTLEGKAVRQVYEAKGKNIGRSNETSPFDQAILELVSRTKKKLDKGYVLNIEDAQARATNTLNLVPPMLATPLEKVKPESIDWTRAFVQPKLDGHRALYKDGVLYSRGGKAVELPHIAEAIEATGLGHLHLDGEVYLHGYTLQQISKLAKKHREPGEEFEAGTCDLQFHFYDHIQEEPFHARVMNLVQALENQTLHPTLMPVDTVPVFSMAEVMKHHADFRKRGYEGTMLRFGDEPYRDGKRSRTLLKVKEFQDAEFKVIGVEEGKPYIRGERTLRVPVWVCVTDDGKTFTVTCQGTMEEKHDFWINREECLGRMLTVKYHYLSGDGIPQLPVALRFHETL